MVFNGKYIQNCKKVILNALRYDICQWQRFDISHFLIPVYKWYLYIHTHYVTTFTESLLLASCQCTFVINENIPTRRFSIPPLSLLLTGGINQATCFLWDVVRFGFLPFYHIWFAWSYYVRQYHKKTPYPGVAFHMIQLDLSTTYKVKQLKRALTGFFIKLSQVYSPIM